MVCLRDAGLRSRGGEPGLESTRRSRIGAKLCGVQSLFPAAPIELSADDLAELYAYPAQTTWVRANFVSSVDGAAQGPDARSGSLSSHADQAVFALLRTLADVIIVGAGTARAEGYQPVQPSEVDGDLRRALGLTATPAIAVVSRSLAIDDGLLAGGASPTLVVTSAASAQEHTDALSDVAVVVASPPHDQEQVDISLAVEGLVAHGYQRLLCEGGPSLMRDLVVARRLDELCMTISPQLVGGDPLRILHGPALDEPIRLELRHLLADGDDLFCRYTRA